jgi:two-component system chemotaxis response regulator CheB
MGRDGADGMLALKRSGAWNIAQDESSCVVYGMPKAAFELGATDLVVHIDEIAKCIDKRIKI